MPIIAHIGSKIVCILDEQNYQRIGAADPLIIDLDAIERSSGRRAERILITFANEERMGEIVHLFRAGKQRDAMELACVGFTVRRDQGDGAPMVRISGDRESQ